MPNVYQILRAGSLIKNKRLKLLGVWLLHITGRRYLGVFFDPVLACNFRCRMCYFSDEERRKSFRGTLSYEETEKIAGALFHRALKFQIGCGAEPTLHKDLVKIIGLGRRYGVPYISLTTNGHLLEKEILAEAVKAGLHELTLSAHGMTKETYEHLMVHGEFDRFRQLLAAVSEIKAAYPSFRLRINYTINNTNKDEVGRIWEEAGHVIDVLQVRPVQKIGETEYTDFDLTAIHEQYDTIFTPLIEECKRREVVCLVPGKENILTLESDETDDGGFEQATYCYVSPRGCWKDDFDYRTQTFDSYAKKNRLGRQLLKSVFAPARRRKVDVTRKMNYTIK